MLVDADDGAVDERVLEIGIAWESVEDVLKHAGLSPPAEAAKHAVPVPEHLGQVPPGCPGAHHPQHGFQKQAIICSRATGITGLAGQQRRDTLPLLILQDHAIQG